LQIEAIVAAAVLAVGALACGADAPDETRPHWSLQPVRRPAIPRLDSPQRDWLRTPVDAFILHRLIEAGLAPSSEADRRTLIRRVTFDLTGLPPTPAEVEAFVSDPAPDAYEHLVERLLASSRYGEHWGRHWLDVVRFAETEGFEYDRHRAGAWRYRDYVIASFNADKPYDRFVLEQLAGDELGPDDHELLVAAGLQRLGPVRRNAGNQELAFSRHEVLTEMTDVVGTAFLGLTVGCARCHDHMFDPIPQADYFRLQAFFAAAQEHDLALAGPEAQAEWKERTGKIQAEIKKLKEAIDDLTEPREAAQEKLRALEAALPLPLETISTVRNVEAERTPVHILTRGNTDTPERQVGLRLLGALIAADVPELPPETEHPRTLLARWIANPEHPLTARVLVNRLWQAHFGRGLVETANDFGLNGAAPTHPELLDWLASEFVAGGWSIKRMHRLICMSATYRQRSGEQSGGSREQRSQESGDRSPGDGAVASGSRASIAQPSTINHQPDEDNRLLSHYPRRRLSAEEIRDSMEMISGRLNDSMGGSSVVLPVDSDLVDLLYAPAQWAVTPNPAEHDRRSVYLLAKRNLRLPFLEAFDQPDAQTSCARRESSTHALQALELLNGRLSNDLAESLAYRLLSDAGDDPAAQVNYAYQLAAGRTPTAKESELGIAFLRTQPLKEFALAVFNLNAFLYVE
jgi:hypothetical protein